MKNKADFCMSVGMSRRKKYAKGGEVQEKIKQATIARPDGGWGAIIHKANGGMINSIMEKRRKLADGQVDIESNAQEQPNYYDKRNKEVLMENYDEDMMDLEQPMDSNEHGVDLEDEDEHGMSMIDVLRKRAKKMR